MTERPTSFEIQFLRDKNWVVAEIKGDEADARNFAESLLQKGDHEAVRVVRDFARHDGLHSETVILEKAADAKQKSDPQLASIAEAPVCENVEDIYGPASRITIGRLLRKYLDEVIVTPTELLHSPQELKRFGDKGRMLMTAVDNLSNLQAKATGAESKQRRDALYDFWEKINARCRDLGTLPKLPDHSFAAILKAAKGDGDKRDFMRRALMAQRLLEIRSWLGKLDQLLAWAEEDGMADQALPQVDAVIADIVVSAQVVQDLLGYQSNLGTALSHICDLVAGKAETPKFSPPSFEIINRLFGSGLLPQTSDVLLSRMARELRGVNPLSRNEPAQEYDVFHRVLHRLVDLSGVIGGGASAEALVQRYAHLSNLKGPDIPAQAMRGVVTALNGTCRRVHFLLALSQSTLEPMLGDALQTVLAEEIAQADQIDVWVGARVAPRDRMAGLTVVNKALLAARRLPEEMRTQAAAQVDDILARYLVDEGVIEKIDKADDPLAMRAIRLIKFCGSGVLIEGKSLNLARQRVIEHLKQPQFEEKFLSSVPDPSQAEKFLRDFHRLLGEVGFRG